MERNRKIVQVSIVGIVVNLVLVTFKAAVGAATGSIAIIMDAVNNLSDALSCCDFGQRLQRLRERKANIVHRSVMFLMAEIKGHIEVIKLC